MLVLDFMYLKVFILHTEIQTFFGTPKNVTTHLRSSLPFSTRKMDSKFLFFKNKSIQVLLGGGIGHNVVVPRARY